MTSVDYFLPPALSTFTGFPLRLWGFLLVFLLAFSVINHSASSCICEGSLLICRSFWIMLICFWHCPLLHCKFVHKILSVFSPFLYCLLYFLRKLIYCSEVLVWIPSIFNVLCCSLFLCSHSIPSWIVSGRARVYTHRHTHTRARFAFTGWTAERTDTVFRSDLFLSFFCVSEIACRRLYNRPSHTDLMR